MIHYKKNFYHPLNFAHDFFLYNCVFHGLLLADFFFTSKKFIFFSHKYFFIDKKDIFMQHFPGIFFSRVKEVFLMHYFLHIFVCG